MDHFPNADFLQSGSETGYLGVAGDYVHLNPARARLLAAKQRLRDYRWSSFPWYLADSAKRPKWLRVDRLIGEHGIGKDTRAGRREFERRMEARRWEGQAQMWKVMQQGWYLGDEEFKKELLEMVHQGAGQPHSGAESGESIGTKSRTADCGGS